MEISYLKIREAWEFLIKTVKTVFDKVESVFSLLLSKINFDKNFKHNLHMAKVAKKRRIREKYAKRLFK